MAKGFLLTGTDTEVGKTHATVCLMRFLKDQGECDRNEAGGFGGRVGGPTLGE